MAHVFKGEIEVNDSIEAAQDYCDNKPAKENASEEYNAAYGCLYELEQIEEKMVKQ